MDLRFSHSASISNLPSLTPSQIPHWPSLFCLIFFLLSKPVIFACVKGAFNLNTGSVPSCHIQLKMFLNILRHLSVLLERAPRLLFRWEGSQQRHTRCWHCWAQAPSPVQLLWPRGLQPAKLLCLWDSPGMNTGMDCHFLLQGISLTQGLNLDLLCRKQILYHSATWAALQTNGKKHLKGFF